MEINKLVDKVHEIINKEDRKNYLCINLSNGAEALNFIDTDAAQIIFLNIQSTQCEQTLYDIMLNRLGTDFLMHCALGHNMYIIDFGTRKDCPRALYQGATFVKYALERAWFGKIPDKFFITPRSDTARAVNVAREFDYRYRSLSKSTIKYLKKFRAYARNCRAYTNTTDTVNIMNLNSSTTHDGDTMFYVDIVKNYEESSENMQRTIHSLNEWDV